MKIKNKILFSFLFILCLYIILFGIERIYVSNLCNMCEKPLWAQQFEKQSFDFIASGSSRAENHIDIATIEERTNLKGLNIGYGGSAFSENYLALYTFFKNGNKVKYILLNADEGGVIDQAKAYSHPFHGYYYFNELNDDTVGILIRENYGWMKYLIWKYIPFIKYAEFNNIYNPSKFYKKGNCRFDINKGADMVPFGTSANWQLGYHVYVPEKKSIKNLQRIIDLAKAYNSELIFINTPNFEEVLTKKRIVNRDTCISILKNMAGRNKIEYWDFSLVPGISEKRNLFFTDNHLNETGAIIFSGIIAEKLSKHISELR